MALLFHRIEAEDALLEDVFGDDRIGFAVADVDVNGYAVALQMIYGADLLHDARAFMPPELIQFLERGLRQSVDDPVRDVVPHAVLIVQKYQ